MQFSSILVSALVLVIYCTRLTLSDRTLQKVYKPKGKAKDCFASLCSTSPHYPEAHIKKLVNRNKKSYDKIFGTVIEPIRHVALPILKSPFEEEEEEENLCETTRVTVFPKIGYDTDFNPRYIVNIKGHEQSVTFETCRAQECFGSDIYLDYKTHCKQIYNMVRLLYLTEKGNLEYGQFQVPSTCVCTYSKKVIESK